MAPPVKKPVHQDEVEAQTWYAGTDREVRGRALCDVGGPSKVGVGVLELSPGCHTGPAHYHTREEEHLYALAGNAVLHLGDASYPLKPGSYACFPAGQASPHFIENVGTEVFRYLMIGERNEDDHVIYG